RSWATLGPRLVPCFGPSADAALGACVPARGGRWACALELLRRMEDWAVARDDVSYIATVSACSKGRQRARALALLGSIRGQAGPRGGVPRGRGGGVRGRVALGAGSGAGGRGAAGRRRAGPPGPQRRQRGGLRGAPPVAPSFLA
ncbi:unnamed protein product, partial [Prorocentrum cordatum]